MPSKQVEDCYEMSRAGSRPQVQRYQLSDKLAGYGEGVVHGFEEAQKMVEELTGGAITLNPPPSVVAWQERLKRSRKGV